MELGASELWDRILDQARHSLPEQTFRTWLSSAKARSWQGGVLEVETTSRFHAEWLEDKYGQTLKKIAASLPEAPIALRFVSSKPSGVRQTPEVVVSDAPPAEPLPDPAPKPDPPSSVAPSDVFQPKVRPRGPMPTTVDGPRSSTPSGLNPRYTFERFVVGSNSQLAQAASHAVAGKPARMYNPLFLYGGTGLGKTHLMHAIGNQILANNPGATVCYVPSEQFTNELVTSIKDGRTSDFRRRYRAMDLLLLDDVQFLRGKERTQEEFFHTFNTLYDAGHQVVLASDRHPKELGGLEDRLVSRFEWGLVADIKPPDYETRVAILHKKADEDQVNLDPEILDLIARSCQSSVRELEGAIIKLLAFSSLTRQDVTLAVARSALGVIAQQARDVDSLRPTSIRDRVAEAWGLTGNALASKRRTRDLMIPRQVAMFLIKQLSDCSLQAIGEAFGGRDHSTVIHSIRKVEERLDKDPEFRERLETLRREISTGD